MNSIFTRLGPWTGLIMVLVSCSSQTQPDPYNGTIDATALDAKFLPTAPSSTGPCSGSPCYPTQIGYAHGSQISFYNFGAFTPSALSSSANLPTSLAKTNAYDFPNSCMPGPAFDPRLDAYARDKQFPIFSALPLSGSTPPVLGLVTVFGVTGLAGNTCNDIKTTNSIAAPGSSGGLFGATATASPSKYAMWPVIDSTANLKPLSATSTFTSSVGWYKGLQFAFLDGGPIATDASGNNLVAMDGVIVVASGAANAASASVDGAVLLPFVPGEPGYSPIVRLHRVNASLGTYTSVCTTTSCTSTEAPTTGPVDLVLFIVTSSS